MMSRVNEAWRSLRVALFRSGTFSGSYNRRPSGCDAGLNDEVVNGDVEDFADAGQDVGARCNAPVFLAGDLARVVVQGNAARLVKLDLGTSGLNPGVSGEVRV